MGLSKNIGLPTTGAQTHCGLTGSFVDQFSTSQGSQFFSLSPPWSFSLVSHFEKSKNLWLAEESAVLTISQSLQLPFTNTYVCIHLPSPLPPCLTPLKL